MKRYLPPVVGFLFIILTLILTSACTEGPAPIPTQGGIATPTRAPTFTPSGWQPTQPPAPTVATATQPPAPTVEQPTAPVPATTTTSPTMAVQPTVTAPATSVPPTATATRTPQPPGPSPTPGGYPQPTAPPTAPATSVPPTAYP